jgi:hypothetical protein
MTEEDIAAELEVSVPTAERDWRKARAFLFEQLRTLPAAACGSHGPAFGGHVSWQAPRPRDIPM